MAKPDALNARQRRFVEAFSGNACAAALEAGYAHANHGPRLMEQPLIVAAIRARESERLSALVATRLERQAFWSETMKNGDLEMRDRLKASELLGRSEADFTDKLQAEHRISHEDALSALE